MKITIESMTGFASTTITLPPNAQNQTAQLTISVKSLNGRFFEATCRIPYALLALEVEAITHARAHLKRGSVLITMNINDAQYFKGPIQISLPTLASYLSALKTAQQKFNVTGEITLAMVSQLPNVFVAEDETIADQIKTAILQALDRTLSVLKHVRATEGQQIFNDINARLQQLHVLITAIEQTFKQTFDERQQEINKQLATLGPVSSDIAQQQRMQLYLELDRIDVHEEITRFKTHLAAFEKTLISDQEEKGKSLDFTLQELVREINTLSAKCANGQMSTNAVAIKVELEKCREQVQNIV
jgi:uncharacterized protein (TIGR00255 family)